MSEPASEPTTSEPGSHAPPSQAAPETREARPALVRDEHEASVLLRSVVGLMLIGASLGLALEQLAGSWVPAFVTANVLSQRARNVLLIAIAVGGLLGAVAAVVLLRVGRGRGVARLSLVA